MGDTIRVNLDVVNPIETTTGQRNLWPWNDAILHATTFLIINKFSKKCIANKNK